MTMKAITAFIRANFFYIIGGALAIMSFGHLKKLFGKGNAEAEEFQNQQNESMLDDALDASQGQSDPSFADEARIIADQLYGHMNTTMGVSFADMILLVQDLSYEQGAAVVHEFGIRPYTAAGFTLWSGSINEWIVASDNWTLNLFWGSPDAPDFIDAFEYLSNVGT